MSECLQHWYINCLKIFLVDPMWWRDETVRHMFWTCPQMCKIITWFTPVSNNVTPQLQDSNSYFQVPQFQMCLKGLIPPTPFSWTCLDMHFCPPRTWVPCPRMVNSSCGKAEFEHGGCFFLFCFTSQLKKGCSSSNHQTTGYQLQPGLRGLLQSQELCDVVLVSSGPAMARDRADGKLTSFAVTKDATVLQLGDTLGSLRMLQCLVASISSLQIVLKGHLYSPKWQWYLGLHLYLPARKVH